MALAYTSCSPPRMRVLLRVSPTASRLAVVSAHHHPRTDIAPTVTTNRVRQHGASLNSASTRTTSCESDGQTFCFDLLLSFR